MTTRPSRHAITSHAVRRLRTLRARVLFAQADDARRLPPPVARAPLTPQLALIMR